MNSKVKNLGTSLAELVVEYDKAIKSCANDPEKMSSFCTAQGDDLDELYFRMLDLATQLATGKRYDPSDKMIGD